jgi:hypothetical protein
VKSLVGVLLAGMFISTGTLADSATDIIKDTNFKSGLVVHLGCGDGNLTTALHVNGRCLVCMGRRLENEKRL